MQTLIKFIDDKCKSIINANITPGLGIGIVTNNKIIFTKGYGLADIENNIPYTPNTIHLLASVSKTITGTMVCMLQKDMDIKNSNTKENKLIIDANIDIPMSSNYVSKNMTIKDTLCHRTGAPTQYGTYLEAIGYDKKEIISRLPKVPNTNFRNEHRYTNLLFSEGADKAAELSSMTMDQAYYKLFNMIGMNNTTIEYVPKKYVGYIAAPTKCNEINNWIRCDTYDVEEQMPAGGIYSTVKDMEKYLQFHLNEEFKSNENKIISSRFYETITTIASKSGSRPTESKSSGYGLGIQITYVFYNNKLCKTYSHTGGEENVHTYIAWSPQLNIGIVVLANSAPNGINEGLGAALFTLASGGNTNDAENMYKSYNNDSYKAFAASVCIDKKCPLTKNQIAQIKSNVTFNNDVAGEYTNPELGEIIITHDGLIKVGHLDYVPIVHNGNNENSENNEYVFYLENKFKLIYPGKISFIDNNMIHVDYFCSNGSYNKINSNWINNNLNWGSNMYIIILVLIVLIFLIWLVYHIYSMPTTSTLTTTSTSTTVTTTKSE